MKNVTCSGFEERVLKRFLASFPSLDDAFDPLDLAKGEKLYLAHYKIVNNAITLYKREMLGRILSMHYLRLVVNL